MVLAISNLSHHTSFQDTGVFLQCYAILVASGQVPDCTCCIYRILLVTLFDWTFMLKFVFLFRFVSHGTIYPMTFMQIFSFHLFCCFLFFPFLFFFFFLSVLRKIRLRARKVQFISIQSTLQNLSVVNSRWKWNYSRYRRFIRDSFSQFSKLCSRSCLSTMK